MSFRAQASLEYMLTFSVALVILGAAVWGVWYLSSGISAVAQQECSFDIGISCSGLMVTSNSSATVFAFVGSNSREYPISNINMSVTLGSSSTSMLCSPGEVMPGQFFICVSKMGQYSPAQAPASGKLVAKVSYCGFSGGDCGSSIPESYVGDYSTRITSFSVPVFMLLMSPPRYNPPNAPAGTYIVNATINIMAHLFTVSSLEVTPDGNAVIKNDNPDVAASVRGACGAKIFTVSFGNQRVWSIVGNVPEESHSSQITISGNGRSENLTLSGAASIVMSGNSDRACLIANTTQTERIFVSGNFDTVRMFGGAAAVTISGNNNKVYLQGVAVSQVAISGNNNFVYAYNSTVAANTISGINNHIVTG